MDFNFVVHTLTHMAKIKTVQNTAWKWTSQTIFPERMTILCDTFWTKYTYYIIEYANRYLRNLHCW